MKNFFLFSIIIFFSARIISGQISNGDFESWTGGFRMDGQQLMQEFTVLEETTIIHDGSSSASIEVTTDDQGITDFRQTINVTPGVEYTFKVYVYHTEGNVKARLYVADYRGYSDNTVTGSWQELSFVYTPTSSSIEIGLRFYDQTGFDGAEIVYVDDFTVTGGTTNDPEPSNHVTDFAATANGHNQIDLSWTDAIGTIQPAGYLIKGSDVSFAAIVAPVDGTPEADAALVQNVVQGTQVASFLGLTESTQYYFKIYPYTNAGPTIDYKTDGTVPQDDATTDAAPALPNAWINEFHYDDVDTDADEFVEVAIEDASTYVLSDFQVNLYNGGNSQSYDARTLDNYTVGDIVLEDGRTFNLFYFVYPVNGIQNGSPDGLALSYQGTLIQFLSYEGSFSASDGPANGITSNDIGISESSAAEGSSLGLTGIGTEYSDFTWAAFDASATPGSQNSSQAFPVELNSFSASSTGNNVLLSWSTATELNNFGFEIQRSQDNTSWEKVGFVNGSGTVNAPQNYSFTDNTVSLSASYLYRLKQLDNDGAFEYSPTVELVLGTPDNYKLAQNYPNPFNPSTQISFDLPENGFVNLSIFNTLGQKVQTLVNANLQAGYHKINFNAKDLTSGTYLYRLEVNNFVQIKKMLFVK